MATTNSTTNYELSQYVGSDVTSYLTNYNSDMTKIDAQMKRNADSAATANDNATIAVSTATSAASDASTALSTANTASSTAGAAQTAAEAAQTAAGAAQTDAAAALRASASNTIGNLAPAYDPTLTYAVGDLVTYVDPETNQGKLYKNIVPITTPEAFNINKWDDVTTSEVFVDKAILVSSHNVVSGETYKDALDSLISGVTIDPDSEYYLVRIDSTSNVIKYIEQLRDATRIYFNRIYTAGSGIAVIYGVSIAFPNRGAVSAFTETTMSSANGVVQSTETNNVVDSNIVKYELYRSKR